MEEKMIKAFMPVTKSADGKFVGILSDSSMDRDGEFMSKKLLSSWTKNRSIKALANHENKMQSWVGGWRNLKTINKGDNTALMAEPWFFSEEANPLASQIKKQVEEAIENGENPGISIGAIPNGATKKEIEGKYHKVYEDAELVEATWVPIQSNRNATFGHIAKEFDLNDNMEVNKMTEEELKKTPDKEEVKEDIQEPKAEEAEVKEDDTPAEETKEEVKEETKEEPKAEEELEVKPVDEKQKELEAENKELKTRLEKLEKESSKLATIDGPVTHKEVEDDGPFTIEKQLGLRFGGK